MERETLKNLQPFVLFCFFFVILWRFKSSPRHHISAPPFPNHWWSLNLWNAGFRGLLNQLSEDDLIRFRGEHLAEKGIHLTEQGLFLQVETLCGIGYAHAQHQA